MDIDFYRNNNISVDLAIEAHDIVRGQLGTEIPGAVVDRHKFPSATVTTVKVVEEQAAQMMGKPVGTYITIEAPAIRDNNRIAQKEVAEVLAQQLSSLFNLPENANILIVGLGNRQATPDSLGPKVVEQTIVTRHLYRYAPEELKGGMRSVSAMAPGVLGITGIESAEIIKGVVERIQPELIIAIDALAAGSVDRIGTTIQIADTGISPGSGIGNKRTGINRETMGVLTIAIGVPTVVNAAIIAQVTLEHFLEKLKTNPMLNQIQQSVMPDYAQGIINDILSPFGGNLMVTPKEVDSLILDTSKIVAGGISMALHPAISTEEYSMYLN
ncbi:MAG: GPR endopeptidase [Desulfotomaculaceae bacterium]|nr:GPR endopeptidase [Desulfotomaculaceae bacterium]